METHNNMSSQTYTPIQAAISAPQHSPLGQDMRYYIVRPGNTMIPLIPVDQLPFQLQGVPRQLSHQEMFEGGWKFLQETNESALPLPVQAPAQVSPSQPKFLPPDHNVRTGVMEPLHTIFSGVKSQYNSTWTSPSITNPILEESLPIQRRPTMMADRLMATQNPPSDSRNNILAEKWRQPQGSIDSCRSTPTAVPDHQVSLSDSFANIYQKDAQRYNYRTLPPSGVEADPSKKEFCTHWIKTGECAFTATGCRYKHEMPEPQKLRELGFTSQPKWWKDKSGIRSLTWMQRRANQENDDESEQISEPSTRRAFDHSTFHKHTRVNSKSERLLATLKSPETKGERVTLSGDNAREVMESLTSYSRSQVIPNLIDIEDVEIPAPPPSLEQSTSTSSDSGSSNDSSSSLSSVFPSPPLSPRLDVALVDLQEATEPDPRCIRRYSEISWSSNNGKAHKQYPKRKLPLKKAPVHRAALAYTPSKMAGLASSRYAGKGKESNGAAKTEGHEKKVSKGTVYLQYEKTRRNMPALQSQITKLVRSVGEREGRRITAGQGKRKIIETSEKQTVMSTV